jgi:rod shape-determining protein MreC
LVATRSRSARAAVLASSVQRSKSTPYPSKARSALIRRAVVVVLVFVALALITVAFRSPTSGPLHTVQGAGSTALRPFQIAATRVAQPFRDGYDYLSGLSSAKSQLKHEKALYQQVKNDAIANRAAALNALQLEKQLHFVNGRSFPGGYRAVNTAVLSPPGGPFAHSLAIDAGAANGVRRDSPVVSGDALVGIVSNVFPHSAKVTLLTDPNSFVAALDLKTRVRGMVHTGPSGTLILDQVQKSARVKKNDVLVTTGTHNARYPDLYPYGIQIGRVTSVGAADTAVYLQVQVQPFANLGALNSVSVFVPKKPHR